MDDFVGDVLGQYRIDSLIGRGGMGDVYLAHHERLDRSCALKVLRPQLSADPELRERFIREAQAAARLDHPNIVTIYDAGEDEGIAYFAMQLVEGQPLSALIRSGDVTVADAISIMKDVAAALDSAHKSGMVHRDVKPANIIIMPDGTAMLTDFGIVHLRPDAQLTVTGQLLGTPAYMSPEQIAGGEITPQTDVYQLGIVAYELLTGALPFRATEPAALLVAHLHESPMPADERADNIPPEVATTLSHALHKLPAERPETATSFVDSLDAALSGKEAILLSDSGRRSSSIDRFNDTTVPRHRRRIRLTPLRIALAAVIVIAVAFGAFAIWSFFGSDGGNEGQAELPTPTSAPTPVPTATQESVATPVDEGDEAALPPESPEPDLMRVEPNLLEPPMRGEVVSSYDVSELWPPELEGIFETVVDGIPRMVLEAPDASATRLALGANYGDGSAYLEVSLLSNPPFYAEQCLVARVNASSTAGYSLCLTSTAETFAFYFNDETSPGLRVELLPPEIRLGTNLPADWNALEIRAIDDHLWFLINDMPLGAAVHDGPRFGEIGATAFREGDQPFEIAWGVLSVLHLQ